MEEAKYKRRRILINPAMQLKYIGFSAAFLFAFAIIIGGSIYLGIWRSVTHEFSDVRLNEELNTVMRLRQYEAARTRKMIDVIPFVKEDAKILSKHQRDVLNNIVIRTNTNLLPLIAAMMIFVIMASLMLSHRLAGPVYRIKKNLGEIMRGNLTSKFTLREKDGLKDLATEIELSISSFAQNIQKIKDILARSKASPGEETCQKCVKEIEQIISEYKL